jgi:hypothetical protein
MAAPQIYYLVLVDVVTEWNTILYPKFYVFQKSAILDMYHTVLCTDIFKASPKEDLACKIAGSHSSLAES